MNTAFSRTSDSYSTLPMPAICLGFSGLVPFVTAAVASLIAEGPLQEMSERALLAYGAVILTFLGGIRWGVAMMKTKTAQLFGSLFVSVMPALVSWSALLLPATEGMICLAVALTAMFWADLRFWNAPPWYRVLRELLSIGAVGAFLLDIFN